MSVDTDLEKIRLRIGDTDVADSGANARFKDSELNYFLTAEGTVAKAALAAVEAWVAKKASAYDFETDGQSFKRSQEAAAMLALAKYWRSLGITTSLDDSLGGISSNAVTKVDGYSDDIANDEVSATSSNPLRRYRPWLDDLPT